MKRMLTVLLAFTLLFSLAACGSQPSSTPDSALAPSQPTTIPEQRNDTNTGKANTPTTTGNPGSNQESPSIEKPLDAVAFSYSINIDGILTLDELETRIEKDLDDAIASLYAQWETLKDEVDTYEKYCSNAERVSAFYETIVFETKQMCIMLKEYSAVYARMILDSDMSSEKKYKAADGIKEELYDDACDEINDEIYEDLLDEMNDYFYDGILDDLPEGVDYSDWYDICSNEYDQWYDTASDVYGLYYDSASDIYSFYYDLSSKLYSGDLERAEKLYDKFLERIAKDKGVDTGNSFSNAAFDTTLRTAKRAEELEDVIEEHVSECLQALNAEWRVLSTEIDTFEEYQKNVDVIEEFHTHITDSAYQILVMIGDYGVQYAEMIMQSDSSTKDKYKDFEDWRDCIYDDACTEVRNAIYDDLLREVKDYYYDGIIKDAKDSVSYSEWSDARADAYGWWSDARGNVYGDWSDMRGDCYSFFSDIRGELYSGDIEGANNELQRFIKKIDKMKG